VHELNSDLNLTDTYSTKDYRYTGHLAQTLCTRPIHVYLPRIFFKPILIMAHLLIRLNSGDNSETLRMYACHMVSSGALRTRLPHIVHIVVAPFRVVALALVASNSLFRILTLGFDDFERKVQIFDVKQTTYIYLSQKFN
jgi:hypothetical protein